MGIWSPGPAATAGNDTYTGDDAVDSVDGLAGNDILQGMGGDDLLVGGAGDDTLDGGQGSRDRASYAAATSGVTVSLAQTGPQAVGAGLGMDTLIGIEDLTGSAWGDTLTGDTGNNVIDGGDGDDFLDARGFNSLSTDTLIGGAGDDWLYARYGTQTLNGGDGLDTADFTFAAPPSSGVNVNLSTGHGDSQLMATFHLVGIEQVIGSYSWDTIYGSDNRDYIDGRGDDDFLYGAGGDDVIYGGAGFDYINGESGNDYLAGQDGSDWMVGGDGDDTLEGHGNEDQLFGQAGNDILWDGGETTNRDFMYGGIGNDTYHVTSSHTGPLDLVYEGAAVGGAEGGANDIDVIHSHGEFFRDFYGVGEVLHIDRSAGSQMVGGRNNQTIYGGAGNDVILPYGGSNRIDAGAGTDAISLNLYDLAESFDGVNTIVMKAGSGMDYVYDFESGVDKIDLTAFNFGITEAQVLAQAVNADNPGTADDYCYFYLTNAGGVDNFVVFMGLLSSQLSATDFVTGG